MEDFWTIFKRKIRERDALTILMTINIVVFLVLNIFRIIAPPAAYSDARATITDQLINFLSFPTDFHAFITHPWTIVTSIFTHYAFFHIFFNLLMFYFSAKIFVQFFGSRKLVWVYLLGGITGNIFELIISTLFYAQPVSVLGASGSIMAVFIAIALYRPNLKVSLFGMIDIRLIFLAAFFFLTDFMRLGVNDGVAHFAHLGGALIGFLSAKNMASPSNILNVIDRFWLKISKKRTYKSRLRKEKPDVRHMSDDEYNANRRADEDELNAILDKISKKGYDGLTEKEKAFLFRQSKKK